MPTAAARQGDFSGYGIVVSDYSNGGRPFPNSVVPLSRIDPLAKTAVGALPLPNVAGTTGPNGTFSASGTLPPGGHFTVGNGTTTATSPPSGFGGFINPVNRGARSANFSLRVDGVLVNSKQISFTTD